MTYDYTSKESEDVIVDFCNKCIEINTILDSYWQHWRPEVIVPKERFDAKGREIPEDPTEQKTEPNGQKRQPPLEVHSQFEDELILKVLELDDIKSVFKYVYSTKGGSKTYRTTESVNSMIDSDDPIDIYLDDSQYKPYIKNYMMIRALMFNHISNRGFMDPKQAIILGRF